MPRTPKTPTKSKADKPYTPSTPSKTTKLEYDGDRGYMYPVTWSRAQRTS